MRPLPTRRLRVVHFQRQPGNGYYSVERLFADVRAAMPPRIDCAVAVSRFPSQGLWPRVYNVFEVTGRQGDVNHVTGDVHYLTYFLRRRRTLLTVLDCVSLHRLRALFRLLWCDLPLRRAGIVSVISDAARRELTEWTGWNPEAVRVVHCPVSPIFRPAPPRTAGAIPSVVGVRGNRG